MCSTRRRGRVPSLTRLPWERQPLPTTPARQRRHTVADLEISTPQENDEDIRVFRKSRAQVEADAFEENEQLLEKVTQLESENSQLRGDLQELARRAEAAEDLEKERSRAPQRGFNQQHVPGKTAADVDAQDFDINSTEQNTVYADALADAEQDEIVKLHKKVSYLEVEREMAELCRQLATSEQQRQELEMEVCEVRQELIMWQDQHEQDLVSISDLSTSVQELEQTLEDERVAFDLARDRLQEDLQEAREAAALAPSADQESSLAEEISVVMAFGQSEGHEDCSPQWTVEGEAAQLVGHLRKKSPNVVRQLWPYQMRYVVIDAGRMSWWSTKFEHSDRSKCLGSLDFSVNRCTVNTDALDSNRFSLCPVEDIRVSGFQQNSQANGLFQHVEPEERFHLSVRFRKQDVCAPMLIFWIGRWYIGPEVEVSRAVASKAGRDTKEDLASSCPWAVLQEDETGKVVAQLTAAWEAGSFTKAHAGRVLEFSAAGSEYSRDNWLKVLSQQILVARRNRCYPIF